MPHDLLPWQKVYYYFKQWREDGTLERINGELHTEIRLSVDKDAEPSAVIMDSQSKRPRRVECVGMMRARK